MLLWFNQVRIAKSRIGFRAIDFALVLCHLAITAQDRSARFEFYCLFLSVFVVILHFMCLFDRCSESDALARNLRLSFAIWGLVVH